LLLKSETYYTTLPDLRYLAMVLVKVEDFTNKMRCRLVCTDVWEEVSSFPA